MRLGRKLPILLILGLMATGAVWGEEIVHFTNGTYMVIRSHTVEKGMVQVVLGQDASLAFPLSLVERIESGGREIPLTPGAASAPANRIVEGSAVPATEGTQSNPAHMATGAPGRPSGRNVADTQTGNRGIESGAIYTTAGHQGHQTKVAKPFANHPNPNMRRISATGNRSYLMPTDGAAAERGQSRTLDPGGGQRFQPIQIRAKPRVTPNPAKTPGKSEDSGSGGKSS